MRGGRVQRAAPLFRGKQAAHIGSLRLLQDLAAENTAQQDIPAVPSYNAIISNGVFVQRK